MSGNVDCGVALVADEKSGHLIICCFDCMLPLQLGEHRTVFCPECKKSDGGREVTMVLMCAECDSLLKVIEGRGSYCTNCNFSPSMQDTYFKKI